MGGATSELFEAHLDWAAQVGRNVGTTLPPSFDVSDLQQVARDRHWKRVELYDPGARHSLPGLRSRVDMGSGADVMSPQLPRLDP